MANTYTRINVSYGGTASDDRKLKVSADDANPDFLEGKLESGDSIVVVTVTDPGADETMVLTVDETAINHNNLTNFDVNEHRALNDATTTTTNLWSASKIQALLDAQDDAMEITYTPTTALDWDVTPTDVQEGLDELADRVTTDEAALNSHLIDTVDAHDASAISNVPAGNIAATTVQAALNELDTEKYIAADFNTDFTTQFATKDTDDLSEGATNLYFTDARAKTAAVVNSMAGSQTDQAPSVASVQAYLDINDGDIYETTFTFANNISVATNITGLVFDTATIRGFTIDLLVERNTDGLYEELEIRGILDGTGYNISIEGVGDDTGVEISVNASGQFQYTSSNLTGGGTLIFKAKAYSRVA